MKVILHKDIRGVGQRGSIQNVSDGYATNFLFPQKLAEPATEAALEKIEAEKEKRAAETRAKEEAIDRIIDMVRGSTVAIEVAATPTGGLFKKVVAADIVKAIRMQKSVEVPEAAIVLDEPLRTVGEHKVFLKTTHKKSEIVVKIIAK